MTLKDFFFKVQKVHCKLSKGRKKAKRDKFYGNWKQFRPVGRESFENMHWMVMFLNENFTAL